jgi:hypothetical protein
VEIGGIGEIIIFAFTILVTVHSGVVKDMYFINVCILQNKSVQNTLAIKPNQVIDTNIEHHEIEIQEFSYCETILGKHFSFLRRSSSRYLQYRKLMNQVADGLDIKRLLLNQANLAVICNTLMEPYQLRLIEHFKT